MLSYFIYIKYKNEKHYFYNKIIFIIIYYRKVKVN